MRKILLISLIFIFVLFFAKVNDVKAMGTPNNKGYAECWYSWTKGTTTGVMSKNRHFLVAVTVFKDTNGNYNGYAVTGCGSLNITESNIDANKCTLTNYDEIFNESNSAKLGTLFHSNGTWSCPVLYFQSNTKDNSVSLSLDKKSGYDEVPQAYGTEDLWSGSSKNKSQQTGKPELTNDDIDDLNQYSGYTGDYEKGTTDCDEDKDGNGISDCIDAIMAWGNSNTNGKCTIINGKYYGKDGTEVDEETFKEECQNADCSILYSKYEQGKTLRDFLSNLFWIICIIGIVLLIILTSGEFIKIIIGQDDDGLQNAFKHTVTRIICVVVLLLLPMLVSAIITIINKEAASEFTIGEDGNVLCGVASEKE